MNFSYLDHASTTPLDSRVLESMRPYLEREFGNPSSFHMLGKTAHDAIESARESVARCLGARSSEIIFTSGGTEANNLAILGFARANSAHGKHLITTAIEHHSVLGAFEHLAKKEGFEVTYLGVDEFGRVSAAQVEAALRPDTILVSVMMANNEIGTVEPAAEIGLRVKGKGLRDFPKFHIDACQAVGALEVNVVKLHADLLTVNSAKIYGPKANGALFVKQGIKLEPLMFGGSQERGLRPGTENVAGIIGFTRAFEIATEERALESARLTRLRDELIAGIKSVVPKVRLNGHPTERLPNNANISFLDIEGEAAVLYLDAAGIEVSTGSACTSASLDPSHVIIATGVPYEVAHGSLRFTLGRGTTEADIKKVLEVLPGVIEKLRAMSPVKLDEKYLS